jgi:glycosyltransferase involved in cell wall biosynthesis
MKTAVIVTTYNRPQALRLVLNSLASQTVPADQIVVADDGSTQSTAECIAEFQGKLPLQHAWQADLGFRAAAARNMAVSRSDADYLIFLDGDCIVPSDFVEKHQRLAEQGWFVAGNRILLSERLTENVLASEAGIHAWSTWQWLWQSFVGGCNRWSPKLFIPGQIWRKQRPTRWQQARTCNLGLWRHDFDQVNGFDETYNGWGHEDADLAVRMIRQGVLHKEGRFATAVFHLWHEENDRSQTQENEARLKTILSSSEIQAKRGLSQHLG